VADLTKNPIGADLKAVSGSLDAERSLSEERRGKFRRRGLEESDGIRIREQRGRCRGYRLIAAVSAVDVRAAPVGCQLEGLVDNCKNLPPPGGGSVRRRVLPLTLTASNMEVGPGPRKRLFCSSASIQAPILLS
jgi:hypothetical protein